MPDEIDWQLSRASFRIALIFAIYLVTLIYFNAGMMKAILIVIAVCVARIARLGNGTLEAIALILAISMAADWIGLAAVPGLVHHAMTVLSGQSPAQ
jgi:uncharacterized membrane protein YgaE (UPF0421/DUF939 family)